MHDIINYIVQIAEQFGYTGIFIMMILESSFIPFPSEVAMIPAGYLASVGKLNFLLAFTAGTFGALIGATINYFIAYKLGEKAIVRLIRKYGNFFFIKEKHYMRAEKYFLDHGIITIFLARFITVVRQLISLPAGAFKINFRKFFIYTGIGAGLWNLGLMTVGYIAGENKELIEQYSYEMLFGGIILIILIGSIYIYLNKKNKKS